MHQLKGSLSVRTEGQRFYDITAQVQAWVRDQGIEDGLLTLFLHHTSASLLIQENADPAVLHDLNAFFRRVVPPTGTARKGRTTCRPTSARR